MAIYHLSTKPVSRGKGRSAVAAAAYRSAQRLTNERDGLTHDYSRRHGVVHAEIVLPDGVKADWAKDRSALWNAAEAAEKQNNSRVAREFEIALPHELSEEQRLTVTRELAQELANRYGTAVDFAIHVPDDAADIRNHHAHLLMTTRRVGETSLCEKTNIERENKWLLANSLATTDMQLRDLRLVWEQVANRHLALAGLDVRIDHRSHAERGLEIEPTQHVGVHATQMQRQGMEISRSRLDEAAAKRNAEVIREKPEQVLTIITGEKSVFDRADIARTLHRYVNDDIREFQTIFAKVMASPALVTLQAERVDAGTGEVTLARYSTKEMVGLESGLIEAAARMKQAQSHGVKRRHVERAIGRQDAAIQRASGRADAGLSGEQRQAILHITGPERIAAVVGFAGAGKSTMLAAAQDGALAPSVQTARLAPFIEAADLGEDGIDDIAKERALAASEVRRASEMSRLVRGAENAVHDPDRLVAAITTGLTKSQAAFERHLGGVLATPQAYGGLKGEAAQERQWAEQAWAGLLHEAGDLKQTFDQRAAKEREAELRNREHMKIELPGIGEETRRGLLALARTSSQGLYTRKAVHELVMADPRIAAEARRLGEAAIRRFDNSRYGYGGDVVEARLPRGQNAVPEHAGAIVREAMAFVRGEESEAIRRTYELRQGRAAPEQAALPVSLAELEQRREQVLYGAGQTLVAAQRLEPLTDREIEARMTEDVREGIEIDRAYLQRTVSTAFRDAGAIAQAIEARVRAGRTFGDLVNVDARQARHVLRGKVGLFGRADKERVAAVEALGEIVRAAEHLGQEIKRHYEVSRTEREAQITRAGVAVPAPSEALAQALKTRTAEDIGQDRLLMAEVTLIEAALERRFGAQNVPVLRDGDRERAETLLTGKEHLDTIRAVLQPMAEARQAHDDAVRLRHQQAQALSRGQGLGQSL